MALNGAGFGAAQGVVCIARDGDAQVAPGTTRLIDGQQRVYYEGYWIKTYPVPEDTLQAKKQLIHDHVDHCLEAAASGKGSDASSVGSEFKAICRYL